MDVYDRVLEFMKEKDRVLFEITEEHIFDEELFEETFGDGEKDEDLFDFIKELREKVREGAIKRITDAMLCPWCTVWYVFKSKNCHLCTFGVKYGKCNSNQDDIEPLYSKISTEFCKKGKNVDSDFIDNAEIRAAVIKLV